MKTTVYSRLHVDWFACCEPQVDEALAALPEQPDYPLELYCLLLHSPSPKRIAVVCRGDEPLAVVGLRPMGHGTWQPLTHWLLPGAPFPAQPGMYTAAIDALPLDLWVAGWRWEADPLPLRNRRFCQTSPMYCADLTCDIEGYWRTTGLFKTIRNARNRCKRFCLELNHPAALEWLVRGWEQRWRPASKMPNPDLEDRLLVYRYLLEHDRLWTFSLHECDHIMAAYHVQEHRGDLVAGLIYNPAEGLACRTGYMLMDTAFDWAVQNGYQRLDMGGDHEYKLDWAPQCGEKWQLHVSPAYRYYPRLALQKARGAAGRMRELFHHPPHPPVHPNPV